jgi:type IX secretion system PorP/SprF family membrane protein
MKKLKNILVLLFPLMVAEKMNAQDPSFSQFFSSPLNINPALTANINEKWRAISNYRNQWIGPANPYTTGTVSFDNKIFQNLVENYVDENTRIGIGGMMMYDQAMAGVLKSNYASFNISGNILLAKGAGTEYNGTRIRHNSKIKMDEGAEHRLGIGLGLIYGLKQLDFSKLTFGEQFTGYGFNTNLPSGEAALSKMKPYLSTSAGILYTYKNKNTNIDLGASAFHFNKPRQTFVNDDKQYLATRYVVHGNLEALLTDQVILNANGIYQYQSGASYFSVGGALGYYIPNDERDVIINAGLWYWSNNAVIPYIGLGYGNFQFGLTYDITISKLNAAAQHANTFELSLIIRGGSKPFGGFIPAPWK